jgi:hypothetical protein
MMYVYAITDQPALPLPTQPGLDEASLCSLVHQEIAAVFSSLPAADVAVTQANLWRHEAVVEALMADRAILPVRFGTVLDNESAIQAILAAHNASFVADLDRVRGQVEVGLRVLWNEEEKGSQRAGERPGTGGGGRSYLMARLEEERRAGAWRQQAEALASKLHAPLARLAAKSTRQLLLTPRMLLAAAYLIEQNQTAAFQREVEALSAVYPALHFLCTGPWPPYSFVTAGALSVHK